MGHEFFTQEIIKLHFLHVIFQIAFFYYLLLISNVDNVYLCLMYLHADGSFIYILSHLGQNIM